MWWSFQRTMKLVFKRKKLFFCVLLCSIAGLLFINAIYMVISSVHKFKTDLLVLIPVPLKEVSYWQDFLQNTWAQFAHPIYTYHVLFVADSIKTGADGYQGRPSSNRFSVLVLNGDYSYDKLVDKVLHAYHDVIQDKKLSFRYMIKCDTDTLIDIRGLLEYLFEEIDPRISSGMAYIGDFQFFGKVRSKGKWKDDNSKLLKRIYPPYAFGGGYLISHRLLHELVHYDASELPKLTNEDAFIGSLVDAMKKQPAYRDIQRVHTLRMMASGIAPWFCFSGHVLLHKLSPNEIELGATILAEEGRFCRRNMTFFDAGRQRLLYEVDWQKFRLYGRENCCVKHQSLSNYHGPHEFIEKPG